MVNQIGSTSRLDLKRLPTEISGLDEVLAGGLVRGGFYLVTGSPGTGKTVLGNHLAHNHARNGGVTLFATVLAETHDRMLAHISNFRFFAPDQIAQRVHYVNIYDEIHQDGLSGALDLLRRLVREHHATLLVMDGASLLEEFTPSRLQYHRFMYDLHAQLAALGCTSLLLIDHGGPGLHPLAARVDGLIVLEDESVDLRDVRFLHVLKLRGVDYRRGRHLLAITDAGIEVYPRLEATSDLFPPMTTKSGERLAFGVTGVDDMLQGGLPVGSSTLILGTPGTGRTVTGLHFIVEGARRGEPGLIVGFHETPPRLAGKAENLGLELGHFVKEGLVQILWYPPLELLADAWAHQVLTAIEQQRPRRVLVDSLGDVERLLQLTPKRLPAFLAALTGALRAREVTSVFTMETRTLVGGIIDLPIPAISTTLENVILLRYVELRSQIHRLISVMKMRESDYDSSIREFSITERGMEVATTFESAEVVLTGVAHQTPLASRPAGSQHGSGEPH